MERKEPASPRSTAAREHTAKHALSQGSAGQGVVTNRGEFSSKALGIFIRLGNDAFTHAVFGKCSLLSSCLHSGRAKGEQRPRTQQGEGSSFYWQAQGLAWGERKASSCRAEHLGAVGPGARLQWALLENPVVMRVISPALAQPWSSQNHWAKLTDTICSNIAPAPQDASPCVFLSPVAGVSWGGCSAPPAALCTWLVAQGPGKQDVEGSRVDLAQRGGGCAIKTSNAGEEDKQTLASSVAPAEGKWELWPGAGGAAGLTSGSARVRAPSHCSAAGLGQGQATIPIPQGTGTCGQVEGPHWGCRVSPALCQHVQPATCPSSAHPHRSASPF